PYDLTEPGYLDSQRRLGEAMAQAVRDAGVKRVVFLSSLGADQPGGTGLIRPMHDQEERLRAIPGLDLMCLRAGAFMENLYGALPAVREAGVVADGFLPDLPIPMVATRDIADTALQALPDPGWTGHPVREVLGPRDISMNEVTRLLAERLNLPQLAYVQLPRSELERVLAEAGFAPDVAVLTGELTEAINAGRVRTTLGRSAASTTPTDVAGFAQELAAAFNA
ncbi:MAG: FMN-dependent NADH-azoreductase, partial [Rubrivivax sp.]